MVQMLPLSGDDADDFDFATGGASTTINGTLSLRHPDNLASDFEWPFDANRDNEYSVLLGATDGVQTTRREVRFRITDRSEPPVVTRIATGFDEPIALAGAYNNDYVGASNAVVAERKGRIFYVRDNGATGTPQLLIDLGPEISTQGEMGILNVLIYTDGAYWGPAYASGEVLVLLTNLQGDVELRRYLILSGWTGLERPANDTDFIILRAPAQPGVSGNPGGLLSLVNDRVVVGIGDGGGSGDPGGHAQDPVSMRGKILQFLPNGDGFPSDPDRNFRIPPDNPNVPGTPREVIAMGVRNPTRGSYDFKGQATYFVDAGERAIEEVNRIPRQANGVLNFGWPLREGLSGYNGGANSDAFTPPVAQYTPALGASGRRANGGLAYHGRTEAYQAEFFFGDPLTGQIFSFPFRNADIDPAVTQFNDRTQLLRPNVGNIDAPVAIVADYYKDMLILDGDGEIFRYHSANN